MGSVCPLGAASSRRSPLHVLRHRRCVTIVSVRVAQWSVSAYSRRWRQKSLLMTRICLPAPSADLKYVMLSAAPDRPRPFRGHRAPRSRKSVAMVVSSFLLFRECFSRDHDCRWFSAFRGDYWGMYLRGVCLSSGTGQVLPENQT